MRRPNAPCYQCNDRVIGCHGTCQKYKDFKQEYVDKEIQIKEYLAPRGSGYFKGKAQIAECAKFSKRRYR